MHREECPFCQYDGPLAGEELKDARLAHAELLELEQHIDALRYRMAPIEKVRQQTLRNLRETLGLPVERSEAPDGDLWERTSFAPTEGSA